MLGRYSLFLIILVSLAYALIPVVEIKSPNREDSTDRSDVKENGTSPLFELITDISFSDGGFKTEVSLLPNNDCTCGTNHICVGLDINNNFVSRCNRDQMWKENTCKNGGTCKQNGPTTKCYCLTGFQGEDCSEIDTGFSDDLQFSVTPRDRSLKRNNGYTEECAVKVPPGEQVEYTWMFNGELIKVYNKKTGFGSYPGGVLQIDKFTDELVGQYSCIATTSSGTAVHTFNYRIVEDCDVRIYPGPQSETKRVGENALLTCYVNGRAGEVRWKKDGVYIDFDNYPKFKKMVNNYLYISDIGLTENGKYQCEAEDRNGCYSYKEGALTVINLKPLSLYCGISIIDQLPIASSRISKGEDARPNANPWHVTLIFHSKSTSHERAYCGATLITRKYVMTAASCMVEFESKFGAPFAPENVVLLFGTTNCRLTGGGTNRTSKSFVVHPKYGDRASYDNDIALIELDGPVEYTESIRPICLEPADYNDRVFLEDSGSLSPIHGKVSGCGSSGHRRRGATNLQEVYIPYVYREVCEESFGSRKDSFTSRMFCAGRKIGRTGDTCSGDSGGGLVMDAAGRWVQTGIVSWGLGRCDVDRHYGVYTDVGKFYDWIDGITQFSKEEAPDFLTL